MGMPLLSYLMCSLPMVQFFLESRRVGSETNVSIVIFQQPPLPLYVQVDFQSVEKGKQRNFLKAQELHEIPPLQ